MDYKFILIIVFFLIIPTGLQASNMRGPLKNKVISESEPYYQISTSRFVFKGLINFYSRIISPADGPRSPSYPTGSAYGRQAIQKYGFFMGIILTADRLVHETESYNGSFIMKYGVKRYYDPIESNTFWWDE